MRRPGRFGMLPLLATLFATTVAATAARADVKCASVFGDHMVLQRGQPVPVWGTADAGDAVTVTFGEQKQTAKAGPDGKWVVKLAPLAASDKPAELTVAGKEEKEGKDAVRLSDVLVGEVWVCSGQSNMSFPLQRADRADEEIAAADHPKVRLFDVKRKTAARPLDAVDAKWAVCTPATAKSFTAVGYFFGRHVHDAVGVPVGLIHSSWGGTVAEAWTDEATLRAEPEFASIVKRGADYPTEYPKLLARYEADVKAFKEKSPGAKVPASLRKPPKPDDNPNLPAVLYNGMIAPLQPFAIKGAIWYQGEANASRGAQYRKLLPALIDDWRRTWGQEGAARDFPFLIVQLANYGKDKPDAPSGWAELREAQWLTAKTVPNCGMSVTIDIGNPADVHPTDKQDVGKRLGLVAEKLVYGRDVEWSGPVYKAMAVDGPKARVTFDHADGLTARGGKVEGFAVAGEDRKFVPAEAAIDGDAVIVSAPQVAKPVAVRYGWANSPTCTLYNKAGLPAVPFRTDEGPPASAKAK